VGVTQNWRTALLGLAAGAVALAVIVVGLGPALVRIVPLSGLRVFIGVLLLIFGLQWLRKAIRRAAGLQALHDETAIFARQVAALEQVPAARNAIDWSGFVVSFKGVLLEGLEVAFIVLTFGANGGDAFRQSALGAVLAIMMVSLVGVVVHRPLARVPENGIKFAVGIMLISFGTFWGGEGIGVEWTLSDGMILVLAALYTLVAILFLALVRRRAASASPARGAA
jgi:uncharacterized membrane protein